MDKNLKILILTFLVSTVVMATVFIFVIIIPDNESEVKTRFDILREVCEETYFDHDYSSAQDCFDKRLPLWDIIIRETP